MQLGLRAGDGGTVIAGAPSIGAREAAGWLGIFGAMPEAQVPQLPGTMRWRREGKTIAAQRNHYRANGTKGPVIVCRGSANVGARRRQHPAAAELAPPKGPDCCRRARAAR